MQKFFEIALTVIIGLLLIATGLGKAFDLSGYVEVLKTYQSFPAFVLWPLAYLVVLTELVVGIAILVSKYRRWGSLVAVGMHLAYASLAAITLMRDIYVPNCGCFGVFWARPLGWNTVVEDLVMAGLAYALYRLR